MSNRKATWAWADLLYWFFYIPLTAILILALVVIPQGAMDRIVQPVKLDASIMQHRIDNKLSHYSPTYGYNEDALSVNYKKADQLAFSQKQYAYKLTVGDETFVSNKEFYEDAAPLAPIKYDRFTATSLKKTQTGDKLTIIDQVFTKQYDKVPIEDEKQKS